MTKRIPTEALKELRLLESRLESGQSPLQAFSLMGCPLHSTPQNFQSLWQRLAQSVLEGRLLPAQMVAKLADVCERSNDLLDLISQKSLSAKIQCGICLGLLAFAVAMSVGFFPPELQPSFFQYTLSFFLALLTVLSIFYFKRKFDRDLRFLEWIQFLHQISMALECGLTLPAAVHEHRPLPNVRWPRNFLPFVAAAQTPSPPELCAPWRDALRSWQQLGTHYDEGLPILHSLQKILRLTEKDFDRRVRQSAEKLAFQLLIPLVLFAAPAVFILILGPVVGLIF